MSITQNPKKMILSKCSTKKVGERKRKLDRAIRKIKDRLQSRKLKRVFKVLFLALLTSKVGARICWAADSEELPPRGCQVLYYLMEANQFRFDPAMYMTRARDSILACYDYLISTNNIP